MATIMATKHQEAPAGNERLRILLVEDDPDQAARYVSELAALGQEVDHCADLAAMTTALSTKLYDGVVIDAMLAGEHGIDGISIAIAKQPLAVVLILTAFGTIDLAVEAMRRGATGFLPKGPGPGDAARLIKELELRLGQRGDDQGDGVVFDYEKAKKKFERSFVERVMRAARGSIAEAARLSGRYRSDIYRLLERHRLSPDHFKSRD